MTGKALYVVLRTSSDTVETIGPAGATFASFGDADRYAKALRDRYTAQAFIVCEAVAAYATQMMGTVATFESDKPTSERKKKLPKQSDTAPSSSPTSPDDEDENVFPMHPRAAAGK